MHRAALCHYHMSKWVQLCHSPLSPAACFHTPLLCSTFAFQIRLLKSSSSSSTAACSPPSMSSIVCLLLSSSRWFTPLLCRLAIFRLAVPLISSLSLVASLCSVWSTYCPSFLLYDRPISTFVSVCILWYQLSLFFSWFLSTASYLVALDPTFSFPLLFERFSVCHLFI